MYLPIFLYSLNHCFLQNNFAVIITGPKNEQAFGSVAII
uniref:Uncharacterized protein n=1 Tax=Anguilla anguilla TaxID=7936 RepID=A0A0E9V5C7_ANGAN